MRQKVYKRSAQTLPEEQSLPTLGMKHKDYSWLSHLSLVIKDKRYESKCFLFQAKTLFPDRNCNT